MIGDGLHSVAGQSFANFVEEHQGFIRAWLRRLTQGDVHLADDLAQDTFLRALRAASSFRGDSMPRTWLARIAMNARHDHLRKQSGTAWAPVDHRLHEGDDEALEFVRGLEWADHAQNVADAVAQRVDIDRALARLPEAERLVVIHTCWGDLSQADIAALTGMPLGTIKGLHRRAMARLTLWLGDST